MQVAERYGPDVAALVTADDYTPIIPLTYWSFRFMIGLGAAHDGLCAWTLWAHAQGGRAAGTLVDLGRRASRPSHRCSRTAGAGSSPRPAASRGSSTA